MSLAIDRFTLNVDNALESFKVINKDKGRFIRINVDGSINVVNSQAMASSIHEIQKFANDLITSNAAKCSYNQYLLITEIQTFFAAEVTKYKLVPQQPAGFLSALFSYVARPHQPEDLYNKLNETVKELEKVATSTLTQLNALRAKETAPKDYAFLNRQRALQINLALAHYNADYSAHITTSSELPDQVFNVVLKDIESPELLKLENEYGGLYVEEQSRKRTSYAVRLLNQIVFQNDKSHGIYAQKDIEGLIQVCQNNLNFYRNALEIAKAGLQKGGMKQVVANIMHDIDLLDGDSSRIIKVGEGITSFIIPGGWENHYLTYEFRKENEEYFFIVHNKGSQTGDQRLHNNLIFKDSNGKEFGKVTVKIKATKEALKDVKFINKLILAYFGKDDKAAYNLIFEHLIKPSNGKAICQSEVEKQLEQIKAKQASSATKEEKEILAAQAIKLMEKDNSFKKLLNTVTCAESNYDFVKEIIHFPLVHKALDKLRVTHLVNKLGTQILSGRYQEKSIKTLYEHAVIRATAMGCKLHEGAREKPLEEAPHFHDTPLTNEEKAEFIKDIADGKILFRYLPKVLKDDLDIAKEAIKKNALDFKFVSLRLKGNKELALMAIKEDPLAFDYATEKLKYQLGEDKTVMLPVLSKSGAKLAYASDPVKDDKDIALAAIKNDGLALRDVSLRLQGNLGIVLTAINQNPKALVYATKAIKDEEIKTNPALKKNKTFLKAALELNPSLLQYADDKLKVDEQLVSIVKKAALTAV